MVHGEGAISFIPTAFFYCFFFIIIVVNFLGWIVWRERSWVFWRSLYTQDMLRQLASMRMRFTARNH